MAASTEQKLDYLLKKIGYTASKTGLAEDSSLSGTKKAPFAEAIPSPLVTPSTTIWNESALIPTTPPGSDTAQVRVYLAGTSGHRMTVDSTVSGSRAFIAYSTYNNTSTAILGDWIDPQFGDAYIIKVYKGDPNSGGTLLSAAGAGSNDTWFFDYSSGVLNFNGTVIPSGVTDTNIYIVGYRYIGVKGLSTAGINTSATSTLKDLSVTGVSTFAGNINANGNIVGDNSTNISGINSVTATNFFGNISGVGATFTNITGTLQTAAQTNITSVGTLSAVTVSGNINANGNIIGDGATNIHSINNVSASTLNGTLQTAAQPNVTSLGTLTSLNVTGDVSIGGTLTYEDVTNIDSVGLITARTGIKVLAGGINAVGVVTANSFDGNLATTNLTGTITNAQLAGSIANDKLAGSITNDKLAGSIANDKLANSTVSYGGISLALGETDATPAFNLTDATNYPFTSLTGITTVISGDATPKLGGDLNGNSKNVYGVGVLTATSLSGTLLTASQTNITSVGTLSALTVSGTSTLGVTSTTNLETQTLNVTGVSTFANNVQLKDNVSLKFGDNKQIIATPGDLEVEASGSEDITLTVNASGGTASDIRLKTGSTESVKVNGDGGVIVTGILTATDFSGNISGVGATFTNITGTLQTAAQTNITSLGTLGALTVSGNINANGNIVGDNATNISGINSVTATTYFGDGSKLSGIVTSTGISTSATSTFNDLNVTGVSTFAGNINANGNIVGDNATNISGINSVTATTFYGSGANLTGIDKILEGDTKAEVVDDGTIADFIVTNESVERFRITKAGRVGIGTTNPVATAHSLLDVRGDVHVGTAITMYASSGIVSATKFFGDGSGLENVGVSTGDISSNRITTGTLNVTGVSTFAGDMNAKDKLYFDENTGTKYMFGSGVDLKTVIASEGDWLLTLNAAGGTGGTFIVERSGGNSLLEAKGTGEVDVLGDFNVTGLTSTSTLNVSGVSTFSNDITIESANPRIIFTDTNGAPDYNIHCEGGKLYFDDSSDNNRLLINVDGHIDIPGNLDVTGDVSIGGTLTYEDVTNIDSVGIVTARTGIKVLAGGINAVGVVTGTNGLSGTILTAAQTNITSVGTLSALTVSGNINANGNIVGDSATNISGMNNISATSLTGALATAAQTNITSVGTLTGLTVSGDIDANSGLDVAGISTLGITSATNLEAQQLNVTGVSTFGGQTTVNALFQVSGNVTLGTDETTNIDPRGKFVRDLIPSGSTGTYGLGRADKGWNVFGANASISGITTVNNFGVTGVSTVGILTVYDTTLIEEQVRLRFADANRRIYADGTDLNMKASASANLILKACADGADTGKIIIANVGSGVTINPAGSVDVYHASSKKLETTSTGVVVTGIATATTFSGDLTGTVNTAAQPNITSLGTLSAVTVSGNINANGNIVGDSSTNITGIAGVTASTLTGTLQTAAQPNITSVGTLTSLDVSGNITGAGDLTLTDTDAGSAAGPELNLERLSGSPADADYLGQINFKGKQDGGGTVNYAKITGKILDASNGTEDGILEFMLKKAGSNNIAARFRSDSLQLLNGTSLTVAGTAEVDGNITANGNIVGDDSTNISGINSVTAVKYYGNGEHLTGITADGVGAIGGLTVKNQSGAVVGTAGSVSTLDFNGSNGVTITATSGASGIATIAITGFSTSVGTFNASSGVATIDSFAYATEDYKVAEYTLHFANGSDIQAQKLLIMQDGSTAYSQEFAVMSSGSQLVSLDATISGANVLVRATPESGISGVTTFRWRRTVQE